nr:structural protein [Periplaneta fuliginosa densovirus]
MAFGRVHGVVVVVVVGYSEAMAKHQGEGVTEGGGGSEDIKERAQSGSVSMGSELRPLISEVQQERFSTDTNRIYNAGYSEIREPNWGLRNRISGWSERVRELTRPNNYSVIEGSDIELPISVDDDVHIPIEEETSFSVSVPEATETTGLLGTSVISAGTGVAGGAATGLAASDIGLGAGAVIGSGIVGYLGHKIISGLTYPFHHYLGPGNPLDNNEPVDRDDAIAEEHDKAYANAKSSIDVINADKKAIDHFSEDFEKNGNLHSLIGKTGLQIKTAIEQRFGVIYPSVSGT